MSNPELEVPVVETRDEYEEYHQQCIDNYLPGLLVTTIPYRKYARVEFDFVLVSGWRLLERDDGSYRGLSATLSSSAVEKAEEILSRYERYEAPSASSHSWIIGDNAAFYTTPKMDRQAAEQLGRELAPVVNDRSNWTIHPPKHNPDEEKITAPEELNDAD